MRTKRLSLCNPIFRSAGISAGLTMVAHVAGAQQVAPPPGSAALEEIVVTARRVRENLQDTPIAVSAFSAADIEARSITNLGDAANFTPNFLSNPGPTGGNDGFFFIRGVGQTDLNAATDPGVSTYVDGVYLGRIMGTSMDTLDVSRIEVLRGPQGIEGPNGTTRVSSSMFSTEMLRVLSDARDGRKS